MIELSVIIVNYNVREFLEQALRSVDRASCGLHVEVFVVDNNSVDGSVDMVRAEFPHVRVIANEANVGFGRANNQAIREARGRFLLILNPDTIVEEHTFGTLLAFMADYPEAGAVGCRILNPDGTFAPESRRAFPTPTVAFYRMMGLSRLFPKSRLFGRYNLTYLPQDQIAEVDALSGSCMLVRRAALYYARDEALALCRAGRDPDAALPPPAPGGGAGLFDESFFMYGEDLDWCFRIQQAGWKIYYTPETQIIHYKGESTKKGELRYVRHFYGSMLQFTRKHFHGEYSRLFALLLQTAILVRAGATVAGTLLHRRKAVLIDLALGYAVVVLAALAWGVHLETPFSGVFFTGVAPAYALAATLSIGLLGGYRRGRSLSVKPVLGGVLLGLLLASAATFFLKHIAYSRAVVLLGFAGMGVVLASWRMLARIRGAGARTNPPRAVLVGPAAEAYRLQALMARSVPWFELAGYVEPDESGPAARHGKNDLPRLGSLRHLRDLVRLRRIDEVIFAADGLSNRVIFSLMQELRDLPVQFKILAEGRDRLIAKSTIADFSAPALVEAEAAVGPLRSPLARRLFEISVALTGLAVRPIVFLLARWSGQHRPIFHTLNDVLAHMPAVLTGRRALVGYDAAASFCPPAAWRLKPGIFSILDSIPDADAVDPETWYWYYVRNQSLAMDGRILLESLKRLNHPENSRRRSPP